jgi:predicted pyridoxine 5'-phosphate oxidase superfamily flavin-nucleotide-binding protein
VEEVLGHCSKAYRRSKLWQPDYVPQSGVPTLTEMMSGHLDLDRATRDRLDHIIEDDARNNLY